jgi:heat-inducible transcriptional repressor
MEDERIARERASAQSGPELTERQRSVLRAVVEDYVLTAIPVGSKALVQRYGLGVSPATVRSSMAELEALGLLTHPHTSAGRVPSDLGYRLYVEALMRDAELDMTDRLTIRHQFSQVSLTSNDWLRLAASVLAGSTHAASVVTPARSRRARFGHAQLVALADGTRLIVLVLADGNVHQRRLDRATLERQMPEEPVDQPALDAAAAALNAELAGLTAPQARRRAPKLSPLASVRSWRRCWKAPTRSSSRTSSPMASATFWSSPSSLRVRSSGRSSRSCSGPTSCSSSFRC